MNSKITAIKQFRLYLLKQVEHLTLQQLNYIPARHNNNIIWNLAHLTSVVQSICYVRSGLPVTIGDQYFTQYMSGTKPERFITEQEVETIKELLISSIDTLQANYDNNLFKQYSPSVMIPKTYGIEVSNISEAIDYLLYHEGLYSGHILSMKHLL